MMMLVGMKLEIGIQDRSADGRSRIKKSKTTEDVQGAGSLLVGHQPWHVKLQE
jgi:hypothetical protein